jgi:type II secretory ATPase GspE/PulE/Tfp pilus assembly ATPase PilB-like protein
VPYRLTEEAAAELGMKSDKNGLVFYKSKGCDSCFRTGYKGRVGLIEVLVLTPSIKALVLESAQDYKIRETARREGMITLRENGIQTALAGETTLDEILRVTAGDQSLDTI